MLAINAIVQCGYDVAPWMSIRKAMLVLVEKPALDPQLLKFLKYTEVAFFRKSRETSHDSYYGRDQDSGLYMSHVMLGLHIIHNNGKTLSLRI